MPRLSEMPAADRSAVATEAVERGSLLRAPASDADIMATSARLGVALPESLRRFYRASNGFSIPLLDAEDGEIWPVERVGWFRDTEPALVRELESTGRDPSDEEYLVYGPAQRLQAVRTRYVRGLVQLTPFVDCAALCLNPQIVHDGEWEAWFLGIKLPGARRYRSFQDLMISMGT